MGKRGKNGTSSAQITFRDPNHPQNPYLDTLGTFFGPQKVYLAILSILHIFTSFSECKKAKNFKCRCTNLNGLKSKNARKQIDSKFNFAIEKR